MKLEISLLTDMTGMVGCRREDSGAWAFRDIDELEVSNTSFLETVEESNALTQTAAEVFLKMLSESGRDWKIAQLVPMYLGESEESLSRIAMHLRVWKGFFREWRSESDVPEYLAAAKRSSECMITADEGMFYVGALCMGIGSLAEVLRQKSLRMPPYIFLTDKGEDVILSDRWVVELGDRLLSESGSFADYLLGEGCILVNRMDFGGIQPCDVCSLAWAKGLLPIDGLDLA